MSTTSREAVVATQIVDPARVAAAMAEVAIIAPDFHDALESSTSTSKSRAAGFVSPPPTTLLLVYLIYLIFIAAPIAEVKLPSEVQAPLTNGTGYIALASAGTVIDHNRRK